MRSELQVAGLILGGTILENNKAICLARFILGLSRRGFVRTKRSRCAIDLRSVVAAPRVFRSSQDAELA